MKKLWIYTYRQKRAAPGEEGQGIIEYALLFAFIALVVYAIVQVLEPTIGNVFSEFVSQAPVAPPSLINYTPPPTYTPTPTFDPNASPTPLPTITLVPSATPSRTPTHTPTNTHTPTPAPPCPITGPYAAPGRVQMENFRCGGLGVAFLDSTASGNGSNACRNDVGIEGPDLALTSDTGGGCHLEQVTAGEWVEYRVSTTTAQEYTLRMRYAAPTGIFASLSIYVTSGVFTAGPYNLLGAPTGSWNTWGETSVNIALFSGTNTIRVVGNTANTNANFNYFDIVNATYTATPTAPATNTPAPTPTRTPTPNVQTMTFYSNAIHDGRVRQDGNTNTSIEVGDTANDLGLRGFLSFDTAAIPDNATITGVQLRIFQSGSQGNPYGSGNLGSILVDIAPAAGFSSDYTLQGSDYNAAAAVTQVGLYSSIANNAWGQAALNPPAYANINKTNYTQIRLYFELATNDGNADRVTFHDGGQPNKPELIVTYTVP